MKLFREIKSLYLLFILVSVFSCTTTRIDNIDPISLNIRDSIPKTVVNFLDKNSWDMNKYRASSIDPDMSYNYHIRYYLLNTSYKTIWKSYINQDAKIAWDGDIISCGVIYSPTFQEILTLNSKRKIKLSEDQLYFMNLNFVNIYNTCVAFKIEKINFFERIIEFRYLETNFVLGRQIITFIPIQNENGEDQTLIKHESYYNSNNLFQDKLLYPTFHSNAIDDFHLQLFHRENIKYEIIPNKRAENLIH